MHRIILYFLILILFGCTQKRNLEPIIDATPIFKDAEADRYQIEEPEHPLTTWQIIDRSLFRYNTDHGRIGFISFKDVAYGNGRFVAVGDAWTGSSSSYSVIAYSDNGLIWNIVNRKFPLGFYSIAYGNDLFIAIGANSEIVYSYNGEEWFADENNFPGTYSITFGNNRFITWTSEAPEYSDGGERQSIYGVAYSDDGKTWAIISVSDIFKGAGDANSHTYTNGHFYVALNVHDRNNKIAYSTDSVIWNVIESENFGQFGVRSIVYGNGRLLVFSCTEIDEYTDGGVNLTYSDDGGITWHLTEVKNDYENWSWINEITFVNGFFIAVGDNQKVAYSRDGITWVSADSNHKFEYEADDINTFLYFTASAYGNDAHVIVGTNGIMRTSQWSLNNIE